MRPPGGDVVLVRALVVRKARVAVDAEEGFFSRADMLRSEVEHRVGDMADDGQHRFFHLPPLERFVVVKPAARFNRVKLIDANERTQKSHAFFAKMSRSNGILSGY